MIRAREARIAGLRRLVARGEPDGRDGAGAVDARISPGCARASAKVVGSATVGPEAMTAGSSPGTSEIDQRDDPRRRGGRGEPAALDRGEMLAHAVHLGDRRARCAAARALTACLSASVRPGAGSASSAEPPPEIRQSTRSSAVRPCDHRQDALAPRPAPAASGTGWRGLDDLDPPAGHAMAVAGDDQPGQRARPVILDRARHGGGGLAGADHDGAALGRRRQMRRQDSGRVGRVERGIEQAAEEGQGSAGRTQFLASR